MATADLLIDRQRLMDSTQGDMEFLVELATVFITDARARARDLSQAVGCGDWASVSKLAHRLKGSSASVGALQVMDIAISLEKMASPTHQAEAAAAVLELPQAIEAAARALNWLAESCHENAA